MPLTIVRQDITKMHTDAIVAASGHRMDAYGWVAGAIAQAAGPEYDKACSELGFCNTGEAKITGGYKLPATYVIHTVGPRYQGGHMGEGLLLKACYENSLKLAKQHNCRSVAFPLVATGGYGFPKEEGLKLAIDTLEEFLKKDDNEDMDLYLVVFDKDTALLSRELDYEIQEYIDDNYEGAHTEEMRRRNRRQDTTYFRNNKYLSEVVMSDLCGKLPAIEEEPTPTKSHRSSAPKSKAMSLESALKVKDESFREMLFRLIDEKKLKNSEVYAKANMSKSHFSKIKNSEDYKPKKETVFALAVALELDIEQTKELLMKAGYAISHSFILDTIVEYFIVNKRYDIMDINIALFDHDQTLLGEKAL